ADRLVQSQVDAILVGGRERHGRALSRNGRHDRPGLRGQAGGDQEPERRGERRTRDSGRGQTLHSMTPLSTPSTHSGGGKLREKAFISPRLARVKARGSTPGAHLGEGRSLLRAPLACDRTTGMERASSGGIEGRRRFAGKGGGAGPRGGVGL